MAKTYQQAIRDARAILTDRNFSKTPEYIMEELFEINYTELILKYNHVMSPNEYQAYMEIVNQIQHKPLEYVFEKTRFDSLPLKVTPDTLIPRGETLEVLKVLAEQIKIDFKHDNLQIIDVCTGSGVMALWLKREFPKANIIATDICDKALSVANLNSQELNLEVEFIQTNVLAGINQQFDVIVANPPYISSTSEVDQYVIDNEPHLALFGNGELGADVYYQILEQAKELINEKFIICFEIGYDQGEIITRYAKDVFPTAQVTITKDLNGYDRIALIRS